MTKLEQAIETLKTLPTQDQDLYVDWILAEVSENNLLELTEAERQEVDHRIATSHTAADGKVVFAELREK